MAEPPSIRYNNPGAINGNASWVKAFPGFQSTTIIAGNNPIARMDTVEHGIGLWWELLRHYRAAGVKTVRQIIVRYGGGQSNYEREYVPFVVKHSGLPADREIELYNDAVLLPFARAMFRMEAGKDTSKIWTDAQILAGIRFGRNYKPGMKPEDRAAGSIGGAGAAAAVVAGGSGFPWEVVLGTVIFVVIAAGLTWLYMARNKPENDPNHVDASGPPSLQEEK